MYQPKSKKLLKELPQLTKIMASMAEEQKRFCNDEFFVFDEK